MSSKQNASERTYRGSRGKTSSFSGRRLIIVGNKVPKDWDFRRGIEESTGTAWEVKECVINRFDGLHKYTRFLTYIFSPFRIFLHRNRYETILSWEQYLGLFLVFYCGLFHVRKYPVIDVMALIYRPKKGLTGKLFRRFVSRTVASPYLHRIIVYSASEADYYASLFHLPREKFDVETLGIADRPELIRTSSDAKQYCVSAGRSNRDYDFLRQSWPESSGSLIIICDTEKSPDQPHIHYERNCHGDDYLHLLSGAYASVVPLLSPKVSSGQLVFLQSFMLGVPVIATENDTVKDYIDNGFNGLIIPKDPAALREAFARLEDPSVYMDMCRHARETFEKRFSLYEMGKRQGARMEECRTMASES